MSVKRYLPMESLATLRPYGRLAKFKIGWPNLSRAAEQSGQDGLTMNNMF